MTRAILKLAHSRKKRGSQSTELAPTHIEAHKLEDYDGTMHDAIVCIREDCSATVLVIPADVGSGTAMIGSATQLLDGLGCKITRADLRLYGRRIPLAVSAKMRQRKRKPIRPR